MAKPFSDQGPPLFDTGAMPKAAPKANGKAKKPAPPRPPHYNERLRSPVPDFSDPHRPPTCLEVDFPILPINRLAQKETNADKPIYQMSKWWARRRSSVFRALLLAAATAAPPENDTAATAAWRVWNAYYANHQAAGSFAHLNVLDPFMGGGTTLVEGARLGMRLRGNDLNPVAWFVVQNELAGSDPDRVRALFGEIERDVKPQIQPFYTTTCPRGHQGRWITPDGMVSATDPITLAPEQRAGWRWEGPEIIYTFWAKHCPCPNHAVPYRTPVFRSPVVAQKTISAVALPLTCPACARQFHAELGPTRMAPAAERVVVGNQPFTETTQAFANAVKAYDAGSKAERQQRVRELLAMARGEPGLCCPTCGAFAGEEFITTLRRHDAALTLGQPLGTKKDLGLVKKKVAMVLLIHPAWLRGAPGAETGISFGGTIGADPEASAAWYERRLRDLALVEVRLPAATEPVVVEETEYIVGEEAPEVVADEAADEDGDSGIPGLPATITLADGTVMSTAQGTVPEQSTCTCAACGQRNDFLTAVKASGHAAPVAIYALQGLCPACEREGYAYSGRFFKAPDAGDSARLSVAEREWAHRKEDDLRDFWPREALPFAHMTHQLNGGIPNWGYTHWWTMFNPRQLLVHAQLLRAITLADPARHPLDVRLQALGAFQQYLRNQNMFCFWDFGYNKLVPHMSNNNYHPKALVIENAVFSSHGRGTWISCLEGIEEGVEWEQEAWEYYFTGQEEKPAKLAVADAIHAPNLTMASCSSTELPIADGSVDLAITDPPFGDNVFYADLADFFYVWLRIPLTRWYAGQPEAAYFAPSATPKALEAITNPAEHPDTRTPEERKADFPTPADQFYQQTLTACWQEVFRVLKPGGLLAFTFHHSEDEPWINVLESLFDAGFILVATYPIRSDESKGDKGQFGSKKIEYDIIHVCRKRLEPPASATWPRMRQWVKDEVATLRRVLESNYREELSEPDIQVILRGKALEYYSRHYGQVRKGSGELLTTREALQGVNLLIDDVGGDSGLRPPESAEPLTYRFLRLFGTQGELQRDALHKLLRGSAINPDEFIKPGWLREVPGKRYEVVPLLERFTRLRSNHRDRLRSDLDQAQFLIGVSLPNSGANIEVELRNPRIPWCDEIESLLSWYAGAATDPEIRDAAARAHRSVLAWRAEKADRARPQQGELF